MKLTVDKENFNCDPSADWDTALDLDTVCPTMTLKMWNSGTQTTKAIATFAEFKPGEWNKMKGEFVVTADMVAAEKVIIYWEKVVKEVTIAIDDFSFGVVKPKGCTPLLHNGNF